MERRLERPGSERHPMVSVICSDARPRPMGLPSSCGHSGRSISQRMGKSDHLSLKKSKRWSEYGNNGHHMFIIS